MNDALTNQYTKLLDHLHRGGQFAHWWTPDSGKFYTNKKTGEQEQAKISLWFPVCRRSAIPAAWRDKNVYFCVHPQSAIPQKARNDGNVTDQKYVKAWVSHVAAVNCFFAEYDVKDYGSKDKIAAHLRTLPLYPSVVIDSGGGFHCYWLLANTVAVTDDNRNHIKRLQYAWVKLVGSDDDAKDLARVLRVPGTLNRKEKYAPNYPTVTIIEADYGRLYSLEEFEHLTEHLRQDRPRTTHSGSHSLTDDLVTAAENLKRLSPSRRDRYGEWMNVGMALKGLGSAGLQLWDEWSRGSASYTEGCCDAKWDKISPDGLGLGSLIKWANDDDPGGKRTYTNGANGHATYTNGRSKPVAAEPAVAAMPVAEVEVIEVNVFDALVSIAQSDDNERRELVEALTTHIGAVDPSQHGRLLKALLLADPSYTKTEAKEFIKACVAKVKKLTKERAKAEMAQRKADQKQAALEARADHTIIVSDRQLRDVRDETMMALLALVEQNPQYPPLYVKVGSLSRIVCDEKGIYSSQEIEASAMRGLLTNAAKWITISESQFSYREVSVFPPKDVASDILTLGKWDGIPALGSIVNAPVFGKDGTLHSTPGYSAVTQLYYTGGVTVGDTTPTPERIAWARDMLVQEMMGDFPFKDDASRAHALAYALSPFVREMINGPVPPTVFDAPTEGTGKSLLINVCTYIFLGHDAPTMADTADDEEWRKRITSKLLGGATHALIDNINRELDSGVLANVWTQPIWDDRTLGVNRDVKIPNRMIWALSANNIQLSRENTRRVVWCRLDANMEKPATRDTNVFRHPDLRSWITDNRDHLVTAVLVLIRAWLAAGKPKFKGRAKGSYEAWAYIMGGILQIANVPGFLGNEDELFEHAVSDADEMGEFVIEWWNRYADKEAGLSRLFKLASVADSDSDNELGDYLNLLGTKLSSSKQRGRQQQLARLLDNCKGRVYRGFKIAYVRLLRGEKMYRLEDHRVMQADGQEFSVTL